MNAQLQIAGQDAQPTRGHGDATPTEGKERDTTNSKA